MPFGPLDHLTFRNIVYDPMSGVLILFLTVCIRGLAVDSNGRHLDPRLGVRPVALFRDVADQPVGGFVFCSPQVHQTARTVNS